MSDDRPLRVAVVCGGLPADTTHLELAGKDVDLTVHRSKWLPRDVAATAEVPSALKVTDHRPAWRSRRGHLAFLYPSLLRELGRQEPDVVHVISEPWGLLALQSAEWVRRHPESRLIMHGCDTQWHHGSSMEQHLRRVLLSRTLPVAAGWAAESEKALLLAVGNGLPPTSMTARIHTNPRDDRLFRLPLPDVRRRARALLGLREEEAAIGFLGRLAPEKGIRQYLDAAERLLGGGHFARFLVAGDGPLREEVERRQSTRLLHVGRLSHPQGVLEFFGALDVLACPSLVTASWEDQGPRSVLEAMMCGVLPVVTPTGALPEMVRGHGVITRGTDSAALADGIVTATSVARVEHERARLSEWARSIWSAPAVAAQLVAFWRVVAAASPSLEGSQS